MIDRKYDNYEIVTTRKLYDYCDMTEEQEEKFRDELYKEQNDYIAENVKTNCVLIHFIEDSHFQNSHTFYTCKDEIMDFVEYLAIKDGIDVVRFNNGNLGVVAYYSGHENAFEIVETTLTYEEYEELFEEE